MKFMEALLLLFIGLKLLDVISWSWFWVFAPIWGPVAAIILIYIAYLAFEFVEHKVKNGKKT